MKKTESKKKTKQEQKLRSGFATGFLRHFVVCCLLWGGRVSGTQEGEGEGYVPMRVALLTFWAFKLFSKHVASSTVCVFKRAERGGERERERRQQCEKRVERRRRAALPLKGFAQFACGAFMKGSSCVQLRPRPPAPLPAPLPPVSVLTNKQRRCRVTPKTGDKRS